MKEFISIGKDTISESYFMPIVNPQADRDLTKPLGGLWFTEHKDINSNSWLMYISLKNSLFHLKFRNKASIITLNENANILRVNAEGMDELEKKYPRTDAKGIDFIELSKHYDGLFFEYHYGDNNKYEMWSVPSLVLFNPNCIENYRKAQVDYDYDPEYDYFFYIKESETKEKIGSKNSDIEAIYSALLDRITKYAHENEFDKDYTTYSTMIVQYVCNFLESMPDDIKAKFDERTYRYLSSMFTHRLIVEAYNYLLEKQKGR